MNICYTDPMIEQAPVAEDNFLNRYRGRLLNIMLDTKNDLSIHPDVTRTTALLDSHLDARRQRAQWRHQNIMHQKLIPVVDSIL